MSEDDPKAILESLEPLFAEAKAKGLWFHSGYQSLWFSPNELRYEHSKGKFIWGPVNWRLHDPHTELDRLERDITRASQVRDAFLKRMAA